MIAQISSVRLAASVEVPNPGTKAVPTAPLKFMSDRVYVPSEIARLIITPSIPGTSPVNRIVNGAEDADPGVNLKTLTPHPSTELPVLEYGVVQSLLVAAGCILQKSEEPHAGVM